MNSCRAVRTGILQTHEASKHHSCCACIPKSVSGYSWRGTEWSSQPCGKRLLLTCCQRCASHIFWLLTFEVVPSSLVSRGEGLSCFVLFFTFPFVPIEET